jgi:hypothetical protein
MSGFNDGGDRHIVSKVDAEVRRLEPDRHRLSWGGEEHEMDSETAVEIAFALLDAADCRYKLLQVARAALKLDPISWSAAHTEGCGQDKPCAACELDQAVKDVGR